ncbi:hypothetical protein LTR85_004372 [Meristemomyces frigidus]|nr:hypothetical protein LTR85_004372 [Meristemomyces frigidus]
MPKRKADEVETLTEELAPRKKMATTPKKTAYTSQQRSAISEFTGVTQSDKSGAAKLLKQYNWNVGAAVNAFFANPSANNPHNPTRSALVKIFDKYRDDPKQEPDEIGIEGTGKILGDLQIGVDDVGALIFSEIAQSPSLGRITREGFVDGWLDLNVDTLPKMRNIVLQRRSAMSTDKEIFKSVYNHTFQLALPPGSKTLPLEMAVTFWQMLFTSPGYEWRSPEGTPWLDWWLEYQEAKRTKAVNKDLWKQTLNFANETMKDDSLTFWNEESSWPSVIDEFVEWVKTEKRPGGAADAMEVE